jgi:sugar transferase (PEP-CTERM/EpsH1 system associated)
VTRIRIMHVIGTLGHGGLEQGVLKIVRGLDASRFEQSICTIWSLQYMRAEEQEIRVIPMNRAAEHPGFITRDLLRIFRRERPHIVHSRNWTAMEAVFAARLARVPGVVHSEHGRDILPLNTEPLRRRIFRRISYGMADRVFTVSRELKNEVASAVGISPDTVKVIYNGVDTKRFAPDAGKRKVQREKIGASGDTVVVGTVGRLDAVKDHVTLLRAAAVAVEAGYDMLVVLVGDGPQRVALERELEVLAALRDRVIFAGRTFDPAAWLCGFDIFVLPSLFEGTSNTLLEAMAAGLPSVVSRVGGNIELLEDGKSGLMFAAGDVEGLSTHLKRLAGSMELRQSLGKEAREHVEECFRLEKMLENYGELYRGLVQGNIK